MRVRLFYKLSAMILLTIAFVSCSDSNKEDIEPNVPTEFTPSNESTIYFASGAEFAGNGGELTISFTCNKKWEATSTKDWCKIMPQGGEAGLNSLQVNVDANSTLENRDAVITIIVGELSKYITIRQSASTTGKVHVENAGSLPELLKCDVSKIEELTISGYLNGTDFKLLREMSNNLIKLDLSEAHIVEGGESYFSSNPQPIGFSGILLAKRQNSFYCTYFLHNRNVADTKSPYPIKRLEVIRWFNQKSMVFNQSLS